MIARERHDAARHMARYSCRAVERNLFGALSLVRTLGRLGQPSQQRIALHDPAQAAQAALAREVHQKQRQGDA